MRRRGLKERARSVMEEDAKGEMRRAFSPSSRRLGGTVMKLMGNSIRTGERRDFFRQWVFVSNGGKHFQSVDGVMAEGMGGFEVVFD